MLAGVRDLLVVEMGQSFVAANKKAINRMIEDAAARVRSKAAAASIGAGAPEEPAPASAGPVAPQSAPPGSAWLWFWRGGGAWNGYALEDSNALEAARQRGDHEAELPNGWKVEGLRAASPDLAPPSVRTSRDHSVPLAHSVRALRILHPHHLLAHLSACAC